MAPKKFNNKEQQPPEVTKRPNYGDRKLLEKRKAKKEAKRQAQLAARPNLDNTSNTAACERAPLQPSTTRINTPSAPSAAATLEQWPAPAPYTDSDTDSCTTYFNLPVATKVPVVPFGGPSAAATLEPRPAPPTLTTTITTNITTTTATTNFKTTKAADAAVLPSGAPCAGLGRVAGLVWTECWACTGLLVRAALTVPIYVYVVATYKA